MLASVAGTVPAREALIANSVPQTATVQRAKATLDVKYDGPAKFVPIDDTALSYAQNTPIPVIRVTPSSYYALQNAVWFVAADPYGAWTAATSVPAVIYTIPPSSPVHYVTYVRIYGSTTDVVYAGYTPGYMGTVVAPGGVVVYGTGYAYPAWVGSVWYPAPITYGIGATVAYSTWGGWNVGFGIGYPVYPPYWGPYAYGAGFGAGMFTGLAVGAAIGASAWGWGWHGGYNVTVNNVYNHWGSRDRPGARQHLQLRARRQHHGRALRQQRLRRPRRQRLPQRERPVAEERERQLEQRQPEPGAAAGEPGPVERLVPVPRPRFRGALGRRPELQPVPLQRRIRRPFLQRRRFREPLWRGRLRRRRPVIRRFQRVSRWRFRWVRRRFPRRLRRAAAKERSQAMLRVHRIAALAATLIAAGCQTPAQMLASDQATASGVAGRRGQFDLNCQQVTTSILSSNVLQPLLWGGEERAEYTIGVAGCERRTTYIVVCALGSPSCFAAAAR